jgi:hypothetical protein
MQETILDLRAEGGSITLLGLRGSDGLRKFVLEKNEAVLRDMLPDEEFEGEAVVRSSPVTSWEAIVSLLNQNQHWHRLSPITIHPYFENRILALVYERGGDSSVEKWRSSLTSLKNIKQEEPLEQKVDLGLVGILSLEKIRALYEKYLALICLETVEFGVKPTEVRHLIGRLGEFHCALAADGTLASTANQHGFDVIAKNGRRVSVKTTAQKSGFVKISDSTLDKVDDLMLIQYKDQSLSVIYYGPAMSAVGVARHYPELGWYELDLSRAKVAHGR